MSRTTPSWFGTTNQIRKTPPSNSFSYRRWIGRCVLYLPLLRAVPPFWSVERREAAPTSPLVMEGVPRGDTLEASRENLERKSSITCFARSSSCQGTPLLAIRSGRVLSALCSGFIGARSRSDSYEGSTCLSSQATSETCACPSLFVELCARRKVLSVPMGLSKKQLVV